MQEAVGAGLQEDVAGLQVAMHQAQPVQEAHGLKRVRGQAPRILQPRQALLHSLGVRRRGSVERRCGQGLALEEAVEVTLRAVVHQEGLVEVGVAISVLDAVPLHIPELPPRGHVEEAPQMYDQGMPVLTQLHKVLALTLGVCVLPFALDSLQLQRVTPPFVLGQWPPAPPHGGHKDDDSGLAPAQDLLDDKVCQGVLHVDKEPARDARAHLHQEGRQAPRDPAPHLRLQGTPRFVDLEIPDGGIGGISKRLTRHGPAPRVAKSPAEVGLP
mmetsp:Transcript_22552/g.62623  ORF Transcript_22552/g.62623 Transcript_22552/m.62623 type:complete len:271 (+) Transcript_22552:666-1478(+)